MGDIAERVRPTAAGGAGRAPARRWRAQAARLLDVAETGDAASRAVDAALAVLILVNVLAVVLESMPALGARYGDAFHLLELVSVAVFSVEYLLRVWSAVERRPWRDLRWGRLRFALTPMALVDLAAVLPFYLVHFGLLTGVDMRFLRALRLLRIFKLTRYSQSMSLMLSVLRENARAFAAAVSILLVVMLLAASGMHVFEREAQPQAFGSIPAAMWWAFATLTTVGYGDVTPVTTGGRVFGAMITVVSIGMVALPAGILASSFSEHLRLRSDRYRHLARRALADGRLTKAERRALETLRFRLGLPDDVAAEIVATVRRDLAGDAEARCPGCGASLAVPRQRPRTACEASKIHGKQDVRHTS